MSKMTTDAAAAIDRSRSHNEIVTITVATESDAYAMRAELSAAADTDEDTDCVDTGDTLEVWGYASDSDDDSMTWRVHIRYA